MAKKSVILAVVGDTHCGSTLGLCPAEGVMLPEGGRHLPSVGQLWMWNNWLDFWARVDVLKRKHRARVVGIHMGDSVDGDHHGNTQIISTDPEVQAYVRDHALLPMKRACGKTYMCVGTSAHVGPGQDSACGKWMGSVRKGDSEWAAQQWDIDLSGVVIQARHHWSMGGLPNTKHTSIVRLAFQLFYEAADLAARRGCVPVYPDLAFRGHQHRYSDSGNTQHIRAIGVPAWQMSTAFIHRVRQTDVADVGGIIVVCRDGEYEVSPVLYTPDPPEIVVG